MIKKQKAQKSASWKENLIKVNNYKIQKFRELHHRIIQKQLQMSMIPKEINTQSKIYIASKKTENNWWSKIYVMI